VRATLPELPQAKLKRFVSEFQFDPDIAEIIVADKRTAAFAEDVMSEMIAWLVSLPETEGTEAEIMAKDGKKLSKLAGNWLVTHLFKHLNEAKMPIAECPVTPENFAEFLTLIYDKKINNLAGQQILEEMFKTGQAPKAIMADKNLGQMEDSGEMEAIIDKIVKDNPKAVEDYRQGKEASFKFLVGMAMREAKGKANPGVINGLLIEKLK